MKEDIDAHAIPSFLYSTPSGNDDFSSCFRDIVCRRKNHQHPMVWSTKMKVLREHNYLLSYAPPVTLTTVSTVVTVLVQ